VKKKLREAINFCQQNAEKEIIFIVPFQITTADVFDLRELSFIKGLVLYHPSPDITANSSCEWLGCFTDDGGLQLPEAKGRVVFVGSSMQITRKMVKKVYQSNRNHIVCKVNGKFTSLNLYRFVIWKIGEKIYEAIHRAPNNSLRRTLAYKLASIPWVYKLWGRLFKRELSVGNQKGASGSQVINEEIFSNFLSEVSLQQKEDLIEPVPGRVILVNAGLAAGGAERQIVNTLVGLYKSQKFESVTLLAEYIDHAPDLDFFLHKLGDYPIEVAQVRHSVSMVDDGLSFLSPSLADSVEELPSVILQDVINLVREFQLRKPSVVHAWQDSTSIKAGIAAAIVGVPRIVLASRNVAPVNFPYHQDYMSPAYRALASLDCVTFLNNSDAGALDYTSWLGLPRERFTVVKNGVSFEDLKRVDEETIVNYRHSLGIPINAPVVGSIFRFWEEKRPILWLQSIALVAKIYPDVHYLIIGDGPMRQEMVAFIRDNKLSKNVHLPGTRPEVATPLSAMNIFLLTSKFEGTPNVVLEAQWLELPIVATDAGGTGEAFEPEVTGLLATKSCGEEIASLVGYFLENKSDTARAKKCGPEFIKRDFGFDRMINETIQLYQH
jgi:glycosyltransferase involved in cell wall biosynthesis